MPPELFIKNTLRIAEDGLGDGTAYYSGASAVVNQANKTFDLTPITKIDDLTTPVDDTLNGHILYFPSSRNKYHIVDFVSVTDQVTTWETPDKADIGPWEVRRALVDNNALSGNPALRLADGQRYSDWRSTTGTILEVSLPNMLINGGAESPNLLGWGLSLVGGTTGTVSDNTVSPILGGHDFKFTLGDRSSVAILSAGFAERFRAGETYRLMFKGRAAAAFIPGDLDLFFVSSQGNITAKDPVFSNISSGTTSGVIWNPTLGTSNEWHSIDFIPKHDFVYTRLWVRSRSTVDLFLDEFYVYRVVDVGALLLFDGGKTGVSEEGPLVTIRGSRCNPSRTGLSAGVDDLLMANNVRSYTGPISVFEFPAGIFPVYTIRMDFLDQSSEMLLCEKWVWQHGPNRPVSFDEEQYDEKTHRSRSGVEKTVRHSQRRTFKGTYPSMTEIDRLKLVNDWKPYHKDDIYPFGIRMRSTDHPLLMIDDSRNFDNKYSNVQPDWSYRFKEVIG